MKPLKSISEVGVFKGTKNQRRQHLCWHTKLGKSDSHLVDSGNCRCFGSILRVQKAIHFLVSFLHGSMLNTTEFLSQGPAFTPPCNFWDFWPLRFSSSFYSFFKHISVGHVDDFSIWPDLCFWRCVLYYVRKQQPPKNFRIPHEWQTLVLTQFDS